MPIRYLISSDNQIDNLFNKISPRRADWGRKSGELKAARDQFKTVAQNLRSNQEVKAGSVILLLERITTWERTNPNEFRRRGGAAMLQEIRHEMSELCKNSGYETWQEKSGGRFHFTGQEKTAVRRLLFTNENHRFCHAKTNWKASSYLHAVAGLNANNDLGMRQRLVEGFKEDISFGNLAGQISEIPGLDTACGFIAGSIPGLGEARNFARLFTSIKNSRESWKTNKGVGKASQMFSQGGFATAVSALKSATQKTAYLDLAKAITKGVSTTFQTVAAVTTAGASTAASSALERAAKGAFKLIGKVGALALAEKERAATKAKLNGVRTLRAADLNKLPILSFHVLAKLETDAILSIYKSEGCPTRELRKLATNLNSVIRPECRRRLNDAPWEVTFGAVRTEEGSSFESIDDPSSMSDIQEYGDGDLRVDDNSTLYLTGNRRRSSSTSSVSSNYSQYSDVSYSSS